MNSRCLITIINHVAYRDVFDSLRILKLLEVNRYTKVHKNIHISVIKLSQYYIDKIHDKNVDEANRGWAINSIAHLRNPLLMIYLFCYYFEIPYLYTIRFN